MKTFKRVVVLGMVASLFSGCVGPGPNSERGSVAGGMVGALAGAVIGHNSRGGDALGGAILGGAVGAITGGAIGDSIDQDEGRRYDGRRRRVEYQRANQWVPPATPVAPPPLREETISPSPAANAIWIRGYWAYQQQGYTWIAGHWEIPPPAASTYIAAHWEYRSDSYVFVPSYWR